MSMTKQMFSHQSQFISLKRSYRSRAVFHHLLVISALASQFVFEAAGPLLLMLSRQLRSASSILSPNTPAAVYTISVISRYLEDWTILSVHWTAKRQFFCAVSFYIRPWLSWSDLFQLDRHKVTIIKLSFASIDAHASTGSLALTLFHLFWRTCG